MNTNIIGSGFKRVTVSLPDYVYRELIAQARPRQVSQFVAKAVQDRVINRKIFADPIDAFSKLSGVLPEMNVKQIKDVISRGRA